MDYEQLIELGLTTNEAKVYVALLETGETKTGALVKKTGLHRVLIYDALESLTKKGLCSHVIKENIKYFQAANPKRILDFLEEKKQRANQLVPTLLEKQSSAKQNQSVSVYEGLRGLKSAINNMVAELSPGGTHYVFASGDMAETLGSYYNQYQEAKRKNKITTHIMYDESFRKRLDIQQRTVGKIKFYPLSYFPTDTWIYNDKVLIVNYTAKPAVAIVITSKETAQSYKKMFDSFWKRAKK